MKPPRSRRTPTVRRLLARVGVTDFAVHSDNSILGLLWPVYLWADWWSETEILVAGGIAYSGCDAILGFDFKVSNPPAWLRRAADRRWKEVGA